MGTWRIPQCPYCHSIWVCWNWAHWDLENLVKLNPNLSRRELVNSQWGHECWSCSGVHETMDKVERGVPYWFLKYVYGLPDIIDVFVYRLFHRGV
jgi:hypothetical protein